MIKYRAGAQVRRTYTSIEIVAAFFDKWNSLHE
jgi:hypothetical protein